MLHYPPNEWPTFLEERFSGQGRDTHVGGQGWCDGAVGAVSSRVAAHELAKTTKLYDRTNGTITLDSVERIALRPQPRLIVGKSYDSPVP